MRSTRDTSSLFLLQPNKASVFYALNPVGPFVSSGEKLTEELIDFGERISPTRFKKISRLLPVKTTIDLQGRVRELVLKLAPHYPEHEEHKPIFLV